MINWPGLCEKLKSFTKVSDFSPHCYFKFTRSGTCDVINDTTGTILSNVSCAVKKNADEE